jgi:ABC-type sugar transport system ATPase subunit
LASAAPPNTTHDEQGLVAERLSKQFRGRKVVDGVSVRISPGEVVGLLGPNGAGKTTSFYLILGLVPPNGGRVLLDGRDITALPMYMRARRGIGYLPQEASIFRRMTVEENLLSILELQGTGAGAARERSTSCREGNAGAPRSREPWPASRTSCCSTNLSPESTRSRWPICRRRWSISSRKGSVC